MRIPYADVPRKEQQNWQKEYGEKGLETWLDFWLFLLSSKKNHHPSSAFGGLTTFHVFTPFHLVILHLPRCTVYGYTFLFFFSGTTYSDYYR